MALSDNFTIIRNSDFFADISDDDFHSMGIIHHFKETRKGEYIYFEAHLHNALYFLKDGFVKIGYYNHQGEEVIKDIIGKGDVFGQFTLLPKNMDGEFAQAHKSDVSLCMFRVEDFEKLLLKNPQISIKFNRQLGEKMVKVENRMLNLLQKNVLQRLIFFLVNLSRQYPGFMKGSQFEMANIFTHDELARLIGSSRQTVTTLVNQLENDGLLIFSRGRLVVPDVNKLEKKSIVG